MGPDCRSLLCLGCTAVVVAGAPLVSTDPAGGIGTWNEGANETNSPGFAVCTKLGKCTATGVGSVRRDGAATGLALSVFRCRG